MGAARVARRYDYAQSCPRSARAESPCRESTRPVNPMLRNRRLAVAALALSVLARLAWVLLLPNGMNFVDLHVYVDGSANFGSGHLYDYTDSSKTPDFPLPFTYPPFAALVFYPLHFLPFTVVAIGWLLATMAALFGVVWLSFEMLVGTEGMREANWRTAAIAWTAIAMWLEPVRSTFDYGQVNVFLVLLAMVAVRSAWYVGGTLVGIAAGVKLIPAVTGLYFLARRRWLDAVWAAVVFVATILLTWLISPDETNKYFKELLGDARRIGPVASSTNQSLRGALSRILGHDVVSGPPWIAAVLLTAVLAFFAWRALDSDDRLGTLIIVELFGLMVSPISWSHHWIWLIPVILWLIYGPLREAAGARVLAGYWLVVTLVGVPWVLGFFQKSIWTISRPGILSWLGAVDVLGVLALYLWIIRVGRARLNRSLNRSYDHQSSGR
ncbi:mannosyltransferase [Nocardia sp. CDC153]|uniref:mannosyltransferase n=1 Tax=Nocardia sp. CDC153 TaxID=3112167 RepID=UPI002DBE4FE3|nr:mannosyltransferase [Nocardia sp. CDC153]MEC3952105.1 mannosyltransferase [Nocardia sp. CDC153]